MPFRNFMLGATINERGEAGRNAARASLPLREGPSMTISNPGRGFVRRLGLAAAAIFVLAVSAQQRAEALSLASPGTAPSAKVAADGSMIPVRGGHGGGGGGHGGGGFHGGGGGFHGGGFHGGGFHGGGFHGGGYRAFHYGGYHHAYYRPHFYQRHHFHRRFYYAPSYYYPHRYCRVIWTYYGPRRICHRPWHGHHYWHHHRHHHYRYW
jgi:hypothetical protein